MKTEPTRDSPRFRVEDWNDYTQEWEWPGNGTPETEDEMRDYLRHWTGYSDLTEGEDYRIVKFWVETEVVTDV